MNEPLRVSVRSSQVERYSYKYIYIHIHTSIYYIPYLALTTFPMINDQHCVRINWQYQRVQVTVHVQVSIQCPFFRQPNQFCNTAFEFQIVGITRLSCLQVFTNLTQLPDHQLFTGRHVHVCVLYMLNQTVIICQVIQMTCHYPRQAGK